MKQDVSQRKILAQVSALVARHNGRPSLLDAGYSHIGIDDGWQACGTGVHGSFHDANGYPLVNETLFPNMTSMVATGRALGLLPGWCEHQSLAL